MSKPEDIPQDVWILAESISDWDYDLSVSIARAIMAAKAEERSDERITEIFHAVLDCPHEIEFSQIKLIRANGDGNATSQLHGRIASAIRNPTHSSNMGER